MMTRKHLLLPAHRLVKVLGWQVLIGFSRVSTGSKLPRLLLITIRSSNVI